MAVVAAAAAVVLELLLAQEVGTGAADLAG